jgi:hypothetical protein
MHIDAHIIPPTNATKQGIAHPTRDTNTQHPETAFRVTYSRSQQPMLTTPRNTGWTLPDNKALHLSDLLISNNVST